MFQAFELLDTTSQLNFTFSSKATCGAEEANIINNVGLKFTDSMWGDNGSTVAPPPHKEISQEIHETNPVGGYWQRGDRDVCGVFHNFVDINGVPSGGVPVNFTQPGKAQRVLHVQTQEVKNRDSTGGPNTTPAVRPIHDTYVGG